MSVFLAVILSIVFLCIPKSVDKIEDIPVLSLIRNRETSACNFCRCITDFTLRYTVKIIEISRRCSGKSTIIT